MDKGDFGTLVGMIVLAPHMGDGWACAIAGLFFIGGHVSDYLDRRIGK